MKDIAIYQKMRYFFDDTVRYDISISKTIYRYFRYIESSLLDCDAVSSLIRVVSSLCAEFHGAHRCS